MNDKLTPIVARPAGVIPSTHAEQVDVLRAKIDSIPIKQPRGLPGTKTLLAGFPGSGKTTSLVTAIAAGLNLAVIITDPGGEESLIDACKMFDLPLDKLHYTYVAPAPASWDVLKDMAQAISSFGYKDLASMKTGIGKAGYNHFMDLIARSADFQCERCGVSHGAIDSWGPDWMFAVDSLSGVNIMAMELMIGAKPAAHQGEWGVAMNAEEKLIMKWCADLNCFFVLTAHVEREMDETIGKPILTAAALGRKLAPKLPRFFSDYIYSYHEGANFFWSTTNSSMELKTRTLPISDKLKPSFEPVVDKWKQRRDQVQASMPEEASATVAT